MKRERNFSTTTARDCSCAKKANMGLKKTWYALLLASLAVTSNKTTAFILRPHQWIIAPTPVSSAPALSSFTGYSHSSGLYMCSTMLPPSSLQAFEADDKASQGQRFSTIPPPPSQKRGGGGGRGLGSLSLVGAGPGDPDLLTVAAVKKLETAQLVIADRLVSPEILQLVKGELKVANKHPGCQAAAQDEIFQWMREGLEAGRHVCRLKIGDPFVFGRGGEEVIEARKWGVEASVVPGISSAFSAPLLAGIPVTHRGIANQVTMGTGYGKEYSKPEIANFHPERTAVFLMAVGRLHQLCDDLRERGYPESCPVAIIENASTPRQRILAGTVESIPEVAKEFNVRPPATIVVGEVVTVLHGRVEGLVTYKGIGGIDDEARHEQEKEQGAGAGIVNGSSGGVIREGISIMQ